jgi:hypothetical protein
LSAYVIGARDDANEQVVEVAQRSLPFADLASINADIVQWGPVIPDPWRAAQLQLTARGEFYVWLASPIFNYPETPSTKLPQNNSSAVPFRTFARGVRRGQD